MTENSVSGSGFTLVEAIVALFVGSLLLVTFQTFFSQGVKSSMKGQDNLETIRAASLLFSEFRKDMLSCTTIVGASTTISVGATTIQPMPAAATEIQFCNREATTTYSLKNVGGKFCVNRKFETPMKPVESKDFGIPRMVSFKAMQIRKDQEIFPGVIFQQSQILVSIEVDSKDPKFPTKNIKLTSFFISSQMSSSNWNYTL